MKTLPTALYFPILFATLSLTLGGFTFLPEPIRDLAMVALLAFSLSSMVSYFFDHRP